MNNEFGQHLMLDLSQCTDIEPLINQSIVYDILKLLPSHIDMTLMTLPYVVKWKDKWSKTEGISGFVMIAESHISIHTFPEQRYAFVDVFSCKKFDTEKAKQYLVECFKPKLSIVKCKSRGMGFEREPIVESGIHG